MAVLPGFSDHGGVRNTVDWPVAEILEVQSCTRLLKLLA